MKSSILAARVKWGCLSLTPVSTRPSLSNALMGLLGLAGAAALTNPVPAHAITVLSVFGNGLLEVQSSDGYSDTFSLQSLTTPVSGSFAGAVRSLANTPAGTVAVRAETSLGLLRAEASLDLFAPLPGGGRHQGTVSAGGSFSDDITILPDDPGLLFQPAILHGTLRLDGHVFVAANNVPPLAPNEVSSFLSASWSASVAIFDGSTLSSANWGGTSVVGSTNDGSFGTSVPAFLAFQLPVRLGSTVPSQLSVNLFTQLHGTAIPRRGDVSGILSFYDTLSWGGITAITTTDGTPIEFDVISGSGVDWSQPASAPVPLPGTAWLLFSGLVAIGLGRNRRCASRR